MAMLAFLVLLCKSRNPRWLVSGCNKKGKRLLPAHNASASAFSYRGGGRTGKVCALTLPKCCCVVVLRAEPRPELANIYVTCDIHTVAANRSTRVYIVHAHVDVWVRVRLNPTPAILHITCSRFQLQFHMPSYDATYRSATPCQTVSMYAALRCCVM
jgi:hypothetical protein